MTQFEEDILKLLNNLSSALSNMSALEKDYVKQTYLSAITYEIEAFIERNNQ